MRLPTVPELTKFVIRNQSLCPMYTCGAALGISKRLAKGGGRNLSPKTCAFGWFWMADGNIRTAGGENVRGSKRNTLRKGERVIPIAVAGDR
jgi:hypothetical protein